jgi:hypothetical protein
VLTSTEETRENACDTNVLVAELLLQELIGQVGQAGASDQKETVASTEHWERPVSDQNRHLGQNSK